MSKAQWSKAVTPAVVGGAALATVAAVTFTTVVPQAVSREKVELTATITPGSATNWNADTIDRFYGVRWNANYGETVIAPFRLVEFWQSPENILEALAAAQSDGEDDVVVSSGRGAGNASWAINYLAANTPDDPRLTDTLWILDNNVDRPNGGYAARYPFFALGGVNPFPVRNNLEGVQILDVGYEYAWNSSAPTYISNLPALLNAIIAYAYRYQRQDKLPIPAEILDPDTGTLVAGASGHYIVSTDGQIVRHEPTPAGVTTVYVTYEAEGLPMLQPIRDFGGNLGNALADVLEPMLTVLVNASYTDNNPLSDPSVYTPMHLFAPPKVWATAARQLPGALAEGRQKLHEHLAHGSADGPTPTAEGTPETAVVTAKVEAPDEPAPEPEAGLPDEKKFGTYDSDDRRAIEARDSADATPDDDADDDADEPTESVDSGTADETETATDSDSDSDNDTESETAADEKADSSTGNPPTGDS